MNSDNLKNNLSERETLSADEQQISRLIGGLEKVSAPNDFDFRLKARLAAAKENQIQPRFRRTLRYVLPLTAAVIIAAFVLIQAGLFTSNIEQPVLVENPKREVPAVSDNFVPDNQIAQASNSSVAENKAEEKIPDSSVAEPTPEKETTAKNPVRKQNRIEPKSSPLDEPGGSRLIAQSPSNVNIFPEGIPGNQNNRVSVKEFLKMIGIETEQNQENLIIKSVKENSVSGRSGVKPGDVIEAVDEQKLERGNLPPNFTGGKTLTVSRDNKTLKIELKPN